MKTKLKKPFYIVNTNISRKASSLFMIIFSLLFSYQVFSQVHTTVNGITGLWTDNSTWISLAQSPTSPNVTGSAYTINPGTITLNNDLTQSTGITINGRLNVTGNYSATGGSITINNGGTLYIYGNLSSNINITLNTGGTLVVLGSVNITGGTVKLDGNMVVGGNFTTSSNTTLDAGGNIVIAGNYNQNSGTLTINDPNKSTFYVVGSNSVLNTPSYGTALCTIGPWPTFTKTCTVGSYTDLQTNDNTLWNLTNQVLGMGCGITVSQQPTNQMACGSSSSAFSVVASGVTSYQWQVDNGSGYINLSNSGVYSGATTASLAISNVTGLTGYTYRCVLTTGTCIVNSYGATLTIIAGTSPSFTTQPSTATQSLCINGAATALSIVAIAGSGTISGYQWYSNTTSSKTGGTALSGATNASYTPSTSVAGTLYYYCIVTNSNGCTTTSNVSGAITVNTRPTSVISGPASICNGASATISVALTGTAPWNLTYSDGSSPTSITGILASPYTFNITPNSNKTFTITAISDAKCTAIAGDMTGSVAVTLKSRPTSVVSGAGTICKGNSTNVNIALTGTSPWGLTYSDGTTSTTVSGITSNPYVITVSPNTNATYTITALSDASCSAQSADMTGSAAIIVNTRPTSVISGAASICNGTSTTLSIALTGTGPWNLTYSNGTAPTTVNNINTNPYTFSVSPTLTRTYTVTALSDSKCSAIATDMTGSAMITVTNPATASVLSGTTTICNGNSANLNVAITGGTSPYKVILSDATTTLGYLSGNNISKSPLVTTTYTLASVQDANGCYSAGLSGSAVITVITTPVQPSVITPGATLACQSSTVSYSVTNDPVVATYNWSYSGTGATLTPSGNSVSLTYGAAATSGTLTVTATNTCGTSTSRTLAITVNSNVTPSVSIAVSPAGATCYGSTLTYTATPTSGGTPTYQWYLNSTPVGTNSNTWSANYILSSDAIKCIMTSSLCSNAGTNPATSNIITTTINKDVINLTSVSASALCAGSPINVNFTTPCAFTNTPANSFIAQLSNASGSFASPTSIGTLTVYAAGSYTINATIPAATATGTGYLIRVVSSNASGGTGISGNSPAITVSSSTGTPIAPTTFGNGIWNVFCYNGNAGYGIASGASSPGSVNSYLGYYTETNLSFDTRNRWASGTSPITANTTSGSAYIGCTSMAATTIYLSIKRTNIPCGNYRIDIPFHDDAYELYIDGVQRATHNGCCDSHTGAWTGWIGPSNQIEIRLFQGTGGSGIQVTLTPTSLLTVSPNPTICSSASTTLSATGGGSSVTYAWSPATFLNTTSGSSVIVSNPTATTTYTVSATDISSGCATTANVTVNVSSAITLALTTSPNTNTTCLGTTSTTITASGANTYSWSPATGLSATTGASVIAGPGTNVTYTVIGDNGCTTASKTIAFTGQTPGDSLNYAPGAWYALCYDTTLFKKYYGYYTESSLNFNTTSKWNTTNGPATAANTSYTGCYMNGTYYSVKFKRTGIPCGYYQVNVPYHDDDYSFYVDGVMVASHAGCCDVHTNVWTGFIGPTTNLEFRVINYAGPGSLQVSFTPISGIPNLSTPPTVCAGTSTTVSTGTYTGASYSWSSTTGKNSWLSTTTGISTIITPPAITTNGIYYFLRTLTDGTSGCSLKDSVPVTVNPLSNTTVSPSDTTVYCSTATVRLTASGASTYTWSPATGLSATTGSIVNATPGVSTTYTVSGNNNCNTKDAAAKVTVVPLVADNTFPTGKWNIYGYNSTNWTNYLGYYTTNGSGTTGYDFDTRNQWTLAQGPAYATATGGTAYAGCTFGVDNFTTSFKRTGFTCSFYQIDMVFQDDGAELWIDGVRVWFNNAYTPGLQTNIWSGFLNNTTTVEFRQREGGGGAGLAVQFTKKTPTFTSITVSPVTGICSGGSTSATLTAVATGVGNTYTWSPAAGLSSTTGATTTALPATTTKYYVRVTNCSGSVYGDTAITVTVLQPPTVNTHPSPQTICAGNNTSFSIATSNALGFQWEYSTNGGVSWSDVTNGGIYSGATTQTLTLTSVTATYSSNRYRCRTTNWACSTVFSNDALLTVNQVPVNPGAITGTATVCQNATGVAFSVPSVSLANSYNWTLPTGATIATGAGTNSITVDFGTVSGNVTVAGVNGCGNSVTPSSFPVTVNTSVPADPGTIIGTTSICFNTSGVIYTVAAVAGATSYSWTVPSGASITAGSTTNSITVNYGAAATSGNITVVGVNPCGSSANPATLGIIVNSAKPGNPVVITGTTDICSGSSSNYSLGLVTGATSYTWTLPSGSSITSGSGTNGVTIQFGANSGNITAAGTNGCGSSTIPATLAINVSTPLANSPGTITGSNSVCQSVSGIPYSVTALLGATSYTWTVPTGASISSGSTTNSIIASYGALATSGNVTVYGTNICGNSPVSTLAISVNSGVPNNPGSITGTAIVCKSSSGKIYSISPVTGATSYNWTLPSGASITSGTGSNSITVSYNAAATSGNLSVIGVNGCGNSTTPATMAISVISSGPAQPLAFTTSSTNVCPGQSNVIYTIPNDASATSYTWNYSGTGATYSSTTNSASFAFSSSATNGNISVIANNDCGASVARSIAITINSDVSITTQPSAPASICAGTGTSIFSVVAGGTAPYNYQWQENQGSGWNNITNGGVYTNATTTTLSITNPPISMNNWQYRCIVNGGCGPAINSIGVSLTVTPLPATGPVYRKPNN